MNGAGKRGTAIQVVVGLVLVAVVAAAGLLAWQQFDHVRTDRRDDDNRAKVSSIAKAQVLDLTTLDATNLETNLKALATRSTGEFRTQLDSLSSVFNSIIGKQDVVSKGVVTGIGVVSISKAEAQVLVAASATVTQKEPATPKTQRYRMSVDLIKDGGRWLISGMEFVP